MSKDSYLITDIFLHLTFQIYSNLHVTTFTGNQIFDSIFDLSLSGSKIYN